MTKWRRVSRLALLVLALAVVVGVASSWGPGQAVPESRETSVSPSPAGA